MMNTMKKLSLLLFIIIALSAVESYSANANGYSPCRDNQTVECLKENFDELYSTDIELFGKIYNETWDKAINSENVEGILPFLGMINIHHHNAEFSEVLGEDIVVLFLKKPSLFMDALIELDEETRNNIIHELGTPITGQDEEIRKEMERFSEIKKYMDITESYFNGLD